VCHILLQARHLGMMHATALIPTCSSHARQACVACFLVAGQEGGAAAGCVIDPAGACSTSPQNLCLLAPFVVSPATQSSQLVALPALPPALVVFGGQSDAEPSSWTIWPGSATVEYTAGAAAGAAQCAQGSGTKSNVPCRPVDVASLEGRPATLLGSVTHATLNSSGALL
jgi:hypothetical protein